MDLFAWNFVHTFKYNKSKAVETIRLKTTSPKKSKESASGIRDDQPERNLRLENQSSGKLFSDQNVFSHSYETEKPVQKLRDISFGQEIWEQKTGPTVSYSQLFKEKRKNQPVSASTQCD